MHCILTDDNHICNPSQALPQLLLNGKILLVLGWVNTRIRKDVEVLNFSNFVDEVVIPHIRTNETSSYGNPTNAWSACVDCLRAVVDNKDDYDNLRALQNGALLDYLAHQSGSAAEFFIIGLAGYMAEVVKRRMGEEYISLQNERATIWHAGRSARTGVFE